MYILQNKQKVDWQASVAHQLNSVLKLVLIDWAGRQVGWSLGSCLLVKHPQPSITLSKYAKLQDTCSRLQVTCNYNRSHVFFLKSKKTFVKPLFSCSCPSLIFLNC